ncbi:MAG: L,D-transpeptidase [Candidatus Sumerlaea chitinivorans]|nr:L,D-transpeptidase [Candidatus Sumerlaea chitinivorans]
MWKPYLLKLFLLLAVLNGRLASAQESPDIEIWLRERVGRFGDYEFPIIGGSAEYPTPVGAFQVEWKSRLWWSKQWNAPMPYAVFFYGGAAIHEGSLSSHSHGCVRVPASAARYIYNLAREKQTRVFVYP